MGAAQRGLFSARISPFFHAIPLQFFSQTIPIASSLCLLIFYCTNSHTLRASPAEPGDLLLDFGALPSITQPRPDPAIEKLLQDAVPGPSALRVLRCSL